MVDIVQWQPIMGCSYASPGCTNCKAMKLAPVEIQKGFHDHGLVKESGSGPVWTGALQFSEHRLKQPSLVERPAAFYVCPHGDLFHEDALTVWIDQIFDVVLDCQRHWFQVLTKRSRRQHDYMLKRFGGLAPPNLGLGVSCERQKELDDRVPDLLTTPAAARYIVLYPLLGPIKLSGYLATNKIATVLVGEEQERPADPDWFVSIEKECTDYNVQYINSSDLIGAA